MHHTVWWWKKKIICFLNSWNSSSCSILTWTHITTCPVSTSLVCGHLLCNLNMWGSDPYACSLSKPTHRHKQLLPRLRSSKVMWSSAPGSMHHFPRIPCVLYPQGPSPPLQVIASLACIVRWQWLIFKVHPKIAKVYFSCVRPKNGCSVPFRRAWTHRGLLIVQVLVKHWSGLFKSYNV